MEKNIFDRLWALLFTYIRGVLPFTFCAVPKLFTKCPEYLHACDGSREATIRIRDFLVTRLATNCCNRDLFLFHSKQDKTFANKRLMEMNVDLLARKPFTVLPTKDSHQQTWALTSLCRIILRGENKSWKWKMKILFCKKLFTGLRVSMVSKNTKAKQGKSLLGIILPMFIAWMEQKGLLKGDDSDCTGWKL